MAHRGKDTGCCQFFICHCPQPHLDGVHTVVGKVTDNLGAVRNMRNGDVMKKEAKDAISFSNNAIHSRKHMEYHSLSKSKADRHMEPFIIDVMPTEDSDFVLSSHEGEEFIMVMEGVMEISYGKNTYLLEEGDSIYYDSIVPHHVHAYEGQAAKILAVVYTPI